MATNTKTTNPEPQPAEAAETPEVKAETKAGDAKAATKVATYTVTYTGDKRPKWESGGLQIGEFTFVADQPQVLTNEQHDTLQELLADNKNYKFQIKPTEE